MVTLEFRRKSGKRMRVNIESVSMVIENEDENKGAVGAGVICFYPHLGISPVISDHRYSWISKKYEEKLAHCVRLKQMVQ